MIADGSNCKYCMEYEKQNCDGKVMDCMCRRCPRNLGQCLITRYCRETESAIM